MGLDDVFITKRLNRLIKVCDCNECGWINITEAEQQDKRIMHKCEFYGKRLRHRAITRDHDDYIYPCDECAKNYHEHFTPRDSRH